MQTKRANKILGYLPDGAGEPVQVIIGHDIGEKWMKFNILTGEITTILSDEFSELKQSVITCDDSIRTEIYNRMKKSPLVYSKYVKLLDTKFTRY